MTLTSFATAKNNKVGDKVTLYEDHETIVEMYTDLSGNRILNQYLNGKLIQRDTLLTSSPNSIKRDFFDDSVTRKSSSDVIYIEQYGKLTSDNNERVTLRCANSRNNQISRCFRYRIYLLWLEVYI